LSKSYGTPNGLKVGQLFVDRRELHELSVHRPTQAGISGTKLEGADSICLSGGYVDDQDHGDYIIYTGHGGNDAQTKKQIADQSVDAPGNAGLITSWVQGLPVRVVRGARHKSPYSPQVGYQYAGLFTVTEFWVEKGLDGFNVVRFRLDRIPEQAQLVTKIEVDPDPAYSTSTVTRRIRDTALTREVKSIYNNRCQICSTAVEGLGERQYSEGAHVMPIGRPHLGPDTLDNILCLCPNHHVQMDIGGMIILKNFDVATDEDSAAFGSLSFEKHHTLNDRFASFHRNLWAARNKTIATTPRSRLLDAESSAAGR
jgi:putative restriction endonuclease